MKPTQALAGCGVLFGLALLVARADNSGASSTPPPTAAAPAPLAAHPLVITPQGPWLQSSPPVRPEYAETPVFDGPIGGVRSYNSTVSTDSENLDPADAERIAEQTYRETQEDNKTPDDKLQDQAAQEQVYEQDWMLRDYTAALKKRGLEKADFTNPYLIPAPTDPDHPEAPVDPLLNPPEKKKPSATDPSALPFDDTSSLTPKKTLVSTGFQPLLPPLISPAPAATHGTVGLDELSAANPNDSMLTVPTPDASSDNAVDSLLEVPGLTAATQNGLAPNDTTDFDQGSPGANRPRPASSFLVPTVPTSDVAEFFKKQAEALAPPGSPGTVATLPLPTKPRLVIDPEPMAKPALSGLRSHVDDPFDILKQ